MEQANSPLGKDSTYQKVSMAVGWILLTAHDRYPGDLPYLF
jgi:hypothetical protein